MRRPTSIISEPNTNRLPTDPNKFRAHVYGRGFNHHAVGPTEAEAVFRAVSRWVRLDRQTRANQMDPVDQLKGDY